MKLIGVAIALLISTTTISSHPLYNTTDDYIADSNYNSSDIHNHDSDADYCSGFKITSQTDANITWDEYSKQEVEFDFTNSKIWHVEYVDLVSYESGKVIDEWAIGPWYRDHPRTDKHEIYLYHSDTGYYQFLVTATTHDHYRCKYFSNKFKVVRHSEDHNRYHDYDHDSHSEEQKSSGPPNYSSETTTTYVVDAMVTTSSPAAATSSSDTNAYLQAIRDDIAKIREDVNSSSTSGDGWTQDINKFEQDLDAIKTHDTGSWTDEIDAIEKEFDTLKTQGNNKTIDQEFEAIFKEIEASASLTTTDPGTSTPTTSSSSSSNDTQPTPVVNAESDLQPTTPEDELKKLHDEWTTGTNSSELQDEWKSYIERLEEKYPNKTDEITKLNDSVEADTKEFTDENGYNTYLDAMEEELNVVNHYSGDDASSVTSTSSTTEPPLPTGQ